MFVKTSALVIALAATSSLAFAFSSGPPASRTGALALGGKPAEPFCTACHVTFAANLPGATLALVDIPDSYTPDSVYTLRIQMSSTFTPVGIGRRWGFELTALNAATGDSAGSFASLGNLTQTIVGAGTYVARRYIEHTSAGTKQGDNGPVQWQVSWKAPPAGAGRVIFFAAGNASNNSSTNTGDHIYTTRDTSEERITVGAPPAPIAGLVLSAGPNPMRHSTTLRFALAEPTDLSLDVLDVQGRLVRSLARGAREAGSHAIAWDGRDANGAAAPAGLYFARLRAGDARARVARIVVER